MKSELKAKFLQHLTRKKGDKGFTLIELLVVIIIIGILSAIALPAFLNQANKAKQSEAKQYVGTINRTQQSYFAENSKFASDFTQMTNPIPTQTNNYIYKLTAGGSGTTPNIVTAATPLTTLSGLKSYAGMVAQTATTGTGEATTTAVLCETKLPSATAPTPAAPKAAGDQPACDANSIAM
jgi:prepilin-type N-terminal cleavage/methylation domain-containing protein